MLVNPSEVRLSTGASVIRHLNLWARDRVTTPEQWQEVLAASRSWLDRSVRNQLLLASQGALGPAAGIETWRLMPSTDGSPCAVRAGEHPYLIRVPITDAGTEPDPYLGGAR